MGYNATVHSYQHPCHQMRILIKGSTYTAGCSKTIHTRQLAQRLRKNGYSLDGIIPHTLAAPPVALRRHHNGTTNNIEEAALTDMYTV